MRRRLPIILMIVISMVYHSCDSTLNIDKPKGLYKYIGDDGNQTAVDMVMDPDGNAYILGSTTSNGVLGMQLYVVMTSPNGEVQWQQSYGDAGDETPKDIEMLADGTLAVLADRPDGQFVIYRLSKDDGSEKMAHKINGTRFPDHVSSITQINDGFVVVGYSDSLSIKNGLVYRYDVNMDTVPTSWVYKITQSIGSVGYDVLPIKMYQKDANHFFLFGYTNSPIGDNIPDFNYFVLASGFDNSFINGFQLVPGPDPTSDERLTSAMQVPSQSGGGFILTGYTSASNGSRQDIFVARIVDDPSSATNNFIQGTPRVITSNLADLSGSVAFTYPSATAGFYVLASQGTAGDNNLYLTKLDNSLLNAWGNDNPGRTLGGVGDDAGAAVAETGDGRILVVGTMVLGDLKGQRKIVLMNLDSDGMFGN